MKRLLTLIVFFAGLNLSAQFSPAAGKPGSNALRYDSSCFVAWGTACKIQRGYRDISMPDSGFATVGDSLSPTGAAMENGVLSLGDGGSAIISFANPIRNGNGWDFAVFENTFLDTFLELAFIEVSSDGKKYVRFPAESSTDTNQQTGPFGYTHPEKINNLAGKYVVGYGTPFDLEELKDSAGLDVNTVKYVRITDVVGCMNPMYATRDNKGRKINDPWPTRFPSGGFDLDAVGVIHQKTDLGLYKISVSGDFRILQNPVQDKILRVDSKIQTQVFCIGTDGKKWGEWNLQKGINALEMTIPPGMYYLRLTNTDKSFSVLRLIIP